MVATAALVVGLLTNAEVTALTAQTVRGKDNAAKAATPHPPPDGGPPSPQGEGLPTASEEMTYEQRVDQAVTQKQYENFMTYDGGEQDPIDRTTILADSGE